MSSKDYGKSTPLRLSGELIKEAAKVARRLKISKQDAMRLAMAVGFEDLRSMNYEVARAILAAAHGAKRQEAEGD